MENLLLIIKKTPLVTWKAFLVLWALFLGFMGLVFKFLDFMYSEFNPDGTVGTSEMNRQRSGNNGSSSEKKPVITHDKKRWDYDPWLEKR